MFAQLLVLLAIIVALLATVSEAFWGGLGFGMYSSTEVFSLFYKLFVSFLGYPY